MRQQTKIWLTRLTLSIAACKQVLEACLYLLVTVFMCTAGTKPVQLSAGYELLLNLNTSHVEPPVAAGTLDHLLSVIY